MRFGKGENNERRDSDRALRNKKNIEENKGDSNYNRVGDVTE